ncbi:MAG: hypothetical protein K0S41_502 [Anaerocolumna sp.]|jgi:hypothetical protein|nr:hypothetical protein [Anaerocolumna sp.]
MYINQNKTHETNLVGNHGLNKQYNEINFVYNNVITILKQ